MSRTVYTAVHLAVVTCWLKSCFYLPAGTEAWVVVFTHTKPLVDTDVVLGPRTVSQSEFSRAFHSLKCHGSGRVGSRGFKISRVGSGGVKRFQNLAGRVELGQEVFKISRVGSGHDPPDTGHSRVKPPWPAGCFWLTRGSNPRIWPEDSPFSKLQLPTGGSLSCRRVDDRTSGSNPRVRK